MPSTNGKASKTRGLPTSTGCTTPILTPREYYERVGDIPNVVFSSGAVMDEDGTIRIYYGAADTCICLGTAHLEDLMQFCTIGEEH